MNENTNQIINWCSKGYNPDSTHRETQQEFVNSLQEAVFRMLCMKADVLKKTLESKGLDAETIKQLEGIGAFDSKNLALAEGYTVIGSDFHGDVV